jgi:hypothetical protein
MSVAEPRASSPPSTLEQRHAALQRALLESMVAATPAAERARLGLRHEPQGAFSVVACAAHPHLMLNRVVDVAGAKHVDVSELGQALERARVPGRRDNFVVQLSAAVDPESLAALRLAPFRRDWLVLGRSLSPAAPAPTRLRLAPATRADALAFAEIMAAAFDMSADFVPGYAGLVEHPAWHTYLAFDGAQVVAGASLFVHERTAYLGLAATRPSHRGGGAHDALIALRIELARSLGCDRLLVETGAPVPGEASPSLDNLTRAGFEPLFVRRNYAPPGTTWTGR